MVAWYRYGPTPGAPGSAVLAGHVDWHGVPGIFFHLSELCRVDPCPGGFVASQDGRSLTIKLPEGGSACVYQGNLSPMLGWRSPAFDVRVPAPSIVWTGRLAGPARLRTELCISSS